MTDVSPPRPQLKIRRVNLDTGRENIAVISRRSTALRADVFRGFSRVELRANSKELLATLLLTDDGLVAPDELGLAEPAFRRFGEPAGSPVTVTVSAPTVDAYVTVAVAVTPAETVRFWLAGEGAYVVPPLETFDAATVYAPPASPVRVVVVVRLWE